ncbi:hypothetical protein JCM10212_003481 [Sporobolomyces blumeae]
MAAVRPTTALRTLAHAVRPVAIVPARAATPQCCSTARALSTSRSVAADVSLPRSPRASPSSPAAPTSQHLYGPSPSTQLSYLESLLEPLHPLPHPALIDRPLAERCLTHKSGVDKGFGSKRRLADQGDEGEDVGGRNGNNEKLSFVGRRVLRMYLVMHLTSRLASTHPALLAHAVSPRAVDAVLDTKQLGATVGSAWKLERALRWREVRGPDGAMTGLWKVRGMGVESVVGGVYTSQGIETASQLFDQLVLPNLVFPRTLRTALERSNGNQVETRRPDEELREPEATTA